MLYFFFLFWGIVGICSKCLKVFLYFLLFYLLYTGSLFPSICWTWLVSTKVQVLIIMVFIELFTKKTSHHITSWWVKRARHIIQEQINRKLLGDPLKYSNSDRKNLGTSVISPNMQFFSQFLLLYSLDFFGQLSNSHLYFKIYHKWPPCPIRREWFTKGYNNQLKWYFGRF